MDAPLAGLLVADLTQNVAGPTCTQILGDMGAEVIKVERPGRGDDARAWAPPYWGPESATFMSVNRSKRSLAVDMKQAEGRAVLERLGSGRATISELAEPFGMSLTGMKKHIRLLEEAQLVTTEKVGRVRRCMLAPYAFEGISTWLQRLDRFAQVVERTKGAR